MAIEKIITQSICHCLPEVNTFLISQRANVNAFPDTLRVGLNYTIVLNSACYIEGALEAGLKALLRHRRDAFNKVDIPDFETRKAMNTFYRRIEDELEARIGRSTGPSNYDDLFELILGERVSQFDSVKPTWEGVTILFQFRNVIAHGREISARLTQGWWTKGSWEEQFSGGYRKVEDYLTKKKLITKRFTAEDGEEAIYFTDEVADHFCAVANDFIQKVSDSLTGDEKKKFDSAVWPSQA
jgi:hypothetical protein